jgi:hypothetical protein
MYLDKSLHNDTPTRERSIGTMSVQ